MAKLTYHVRKSADGWTVEHAGNRYAGYTSEAAAIKAATDVAEKLSLNGHETLVILEGGPDGAEIVWRSGNEPPTIESMMEG